MPQRPSLSGRADCAENPRSTIGALFHALSSNGRLIPQQGALGRVLLSCTPSHGVSRSVAVSLNYGDG